MVWSCARRAQADGGSIDWIVVRNRTSHIHAKNRQRVETALDQLAHRLGFRQATGFPSGSFSGNVSGWHHTA